MGRLPVEFSTCITLGLSFSGLHFFQSGQQTNVTGFFIVQKAVYVLCCLDASQPFNVSSDHYAAPRQYITTLVNKNMQILKSVITYKHTISLFQYTLRTLSVNGKIFITLLQFILRKFRAKSSLKYIEPSTIAWKSQTCKMQCNVRKHLDSQKFLFVKLPLLLLLKEEGRFYYTTYLAI